MTKRWSYRGALAMSTLAACAGTLPARPPSPAVASPPGRTGAPDLRASAWPEAGASSREPPDDTRGIHLERDHARLGFDHALQVRKSRTGVPHELHDGDTVTSGDLVRASVQTSEDAYLYLAFCTHHALAVYPSQRGIRTRAGESLMVPQGYELVFDGEPGPEVLYLILSRTELSLADPKLAQALAAARPDHALADCQTNRDATIARLIRSDEAATAPAPSSTGAPQVIPRKSPPRRTSAANLRPTMTRTASGGPVEPPPEPGFERGPDVDLLPGELVWYRNDGAPDPASGMTTDDGITVVRHAFTHVAPP